MLSWCDLPSSPRLPYPWLPFLSHRRQLIARAEAKLSLEETENSSLPSNDCSTISGGSPRNGSPLDMKERKKFDQSPTRKNKDSINSSSGRNKYKNRAEERKISDSYSVDAKELRGESPSAKTVPKDDDIKTLERNINSKTAASQMDCKVSSNSGVTSIAERRGLEMSSMDAIRAGAQLMTAGGAGLQSLLGVRTPFGGETRDNENPDEINSSEMDEISSSAKDFSKVMADTTAAASDVFLCVAPCSSPMIPVSPASAFSGRLMGHEISADPVRERER